MISKQNINPGGFSLLKLTVVARITGGYAIVLLLTASIVFAGLSGIGSIEESLGDVTNKAMPMSKDAGEMVVSVLQSDSELIRFQNTSSTKELDSIEKRYLRFKKSNADALNQLATLTQDDDTLQDMLNSVVEEQDKMFAAGKELIGSHRSVIQNVTVISNQRDEFSDMGDEVISYASELERAARDASSKKNIGQLIELLDNASSLVLDALDKTFAGAVLGAESELKSNLATIDNMMVGIKQSPGISGSKQIGSMEESYGRFSAAGKDLLKAYLAELAQRKKVHQLLETAYKSGQSAVDYLNELNDGITDITDEIGSHAQKSVVSSRTIMIGFAAVALLSAALIGFLVTRSISKPLSEVVQAIKAVAIGDLSKTITVNRNDELGDLMSNLNQMSEKLSAIVREVQMGSDVISSSSNEVSRGNVDLSQRTEEQAASLEETASSMEEMTSTVKQNADNTTQANQLAVGARDQAEKGGEVVGKAVNAMAEINSSSKKIADIIGVIDEIAFQTNLLALNAAVEAARAGEQGRGFAVVAGEVRNLAGRSAEAAKEIKGLIKDSVEKVQLGTELVDESGKTLGEIVSSVKKVTDIISEIAASSQEQASGIEQVNKAVVQMDEMTQQNAALVEEAAAASESVSQQSENLKQQIAFFKLDNNAAQSQAQSTAVSVEDSTIVEFSRVAGDSEAVEDQVQKQSAKRSGTDDSNEF